MKINKIISYSIVFALSCLVAFTGIKTSGAWFSDYKELSGDASVKLSHLTKITEDIDNDSNKHIKITNIGETDVVVRVKLFGGSYVNISAGENWISSDDGWYYYSKVLTPKEVSTEIKAEINKSEAPDYDFDVVVILEAERAIYEGDQLVKPVESWDITYPKGGNN